MKEREKAYKINDALSSCNNNRNHSLSNSGGAKLRHGNHKAG